MNNRLKWCMWECLGIICVKYGRLRSAVFFGLSLQLLETYNLWERCNRTSNSKRITKSMLIVIVVIFWSWSMHLTLTTHAPVLQVACTTSLCSHYGAWTQDLHLNLTYWEAQWLNSLVAHFIIRKIRFWIPSVHFATWEGVYFLLLYLTQW